MSIRNSVVVVGVMVLGLVALVSSASSQTSGQKMRLTAFAVNMNASSPSAASGQVEINVDRWSTEQERQTLISALREQGPQAALSALQKMRPVGTIRTPDTIGYDLRYAHQRPGEDGGTRIVIATDRPIGFWELTNQARSLEYPFTVIEIHLNKDGTGEGKMSYATKVIVGDENTVVLENYQQQPVLLQQVKAETK
jgi:hypothetical protein